MPYVPKLLSRLTPGEIGRDQAVIDYFYDDETTSIDEIMSIGFFNQAGYLFYNPNNVKTYQRIHIRAARGSPFSPPEPPARFQAVVSDVSIISSPGATPAQYKVTVAFGLDTSEQVDSTPGGGAFLDKAWHCFFTKYQGIVRFVSDGAPSFMKIPSRYQYSSRDFCTATLVQTGNTPGTPTAGDNIVSAYTTQAGASPNPWAVGLVQTGPTSGNTLLAWVNSYKRRSG